MSKYMCRQPVWASVDESVCQLWVEPDETLWQRNVEVTITGSPMVIRERTVRTPRTFPVHVVDICALDDINANPRTAHVTHGHRRLGAFGKVSKTRTLADGRQVGATKIRTAKIGARQIGSPEIGSAQIGAVEPGMAQVGVVKVGVLQVGVLQVWPTCGQREQARLAPENLHTATYAMAAKSSPTSTNVSRVEDD